MPDRQRDRLKRPDNIHDASAELYRRAHEALAEGRFDLASETLSQTEIDLDALVEDLRIYQAELEIQNQELRSNGAELERSRGHFAALFASVPIAVLIVSGDGQIQEANVAAEELFGLVSNRPRRYMLSRLVDEADRGAVIDALSSTREAQHTRLTEIALRNAEGEGFFGDVHITVLSGEQDADPRPGSLCAVVDQSDAVRQRERLRQSQAELAARAAEQTCLYEIVKLKLEHELATGEILQQIADRLAAALTQTRVAIRLPTDTFTSAGPDQGEPIHAVAFDLLDGRQGRLDVTSAHGSDGPSSAITPGQIGLIEAAAGQLEGFLRERSAREAYRVLAEYSPEWDYWLGPDGRYLYVSPACDQISGYPASAFRQDPDLFPRLLHPDDYARYLAHRTAVLSPDLGAQHPDSDCLEYRLRARDGDWIWIEHICNPVVDSDGRWRGRRGANRDITERKRAEIEATRMRCLYSTLSASNKAILRHTSEETLLPEICRIILDEGGLTACLISRRVTATGKMAVAAIASPSQPGGSTLSGPGEMLGGEVDDDIKGASGLTIPIASAGEIVGALTVTSGEADFFTDDVVGLLTEMADDVAYALAYFAEEAARRRAERSLQESEERLRLTARVFESTADALLITDASLTIQAVNRAFCEITGFVDDEVQGKALRELHAGGRDDDLFSSIWALLTKTQRWQGERWSLRKDGSLFRARISITTATGSDNSPLNHIVAFSDVTSFHQTREQLDYLTDHDALTGLPNRNLYRLRLEHGLRRAAREGAGLAVLILDIDRFRVINESLGTRVGDELLKLVGAALLGGLRSADTLARLGGDELGIILEDLEAPGGAAEIAGRLLERCALRHTIDGQSLAVTGSLGIAVYPSDGNDGETLLRHAEIALKRAKARGPNSYRFFEAEMDVDAVERLRIESCLREALAGNELHLHYQPQVRIDDGALVAAEALLRWNSPRLGQVPPGRFIPIAEDIGLIDQLGLWVLTQACTQLAAWDRAGCYLPRLAINVSIRQIEQGELVTQIAQVLKQTGIDAGRLELEITESLIMREAEESIATVRALRELGLRLVIDDFGTGYSSLAYLRRLPLEQIKLDKSFVDDLTSDPNSQAVARAVIALGQSLGLEVLAEGVEQVEQAEWLHQAGCKLAQGYYYARPLPPEALAAQWLLPSP